MRLLCRILVAFLATTSIFASAQQPPDIQVSQWLQAPEGFNGHWNALRGKVVVLEFWATWCAPCITAIPRLNQVANEFRNESVVFLAITDDGVDGLRPFLAKQPVDAIIGIDTEHKNWKPFGVSSLPHTVLIGKDGHILGITVPEAITAEVLRTALADKNPTLPKKGLAPDVAWDESLQSDGIPPMMYAVIKPVVTDGNVAKTLPDHFVGDGVSLKFLVSYAYQADRLHLDWQMPEDGLRYRVAFRVPQGRDEQLLPYMRETLPSFFGLQVRWEERSQEVYVLRRIPGLSRLSESHAGKAMVQMTHEKVIMRRQSIDTLCGALMDAFDAVVLDETGLDGLYDFEIPRHSEAMNETLKNIGLEAVKQHRNVRVLVVTPERREPR